MNTWQPGDKFTMGGGIMEYEVVAVAPNGTLYTRREHSGRERQVVTFKPDSYRFMEKVPPKSVSSKPTQAGT